MLGATIGVSTALGPLLGGLIIAAAGARDGWRWVFLVNLFIGVVTVPLAAWLLPRSPARARRGFDPAGLTLLTATLLLLLIPLVEGQQAGWPAWCWACFGGCAVAAALLAAWEVRADRRGGDPLLKPGLLGQMSFSAGAIFAVVYFAGFASVFFTLSILWQEGLGHSALITGLVIAPFSVGSLISAAQQRQAVRPPRPDGPGHRVRPGHRRAGVRDRRRAPDRALGQRLGPGGCRCWWRAWVTA